MIDDKTPNAALPLPHIDNFLEEDVERLRAALTMIDEQLAAADAALSALAARLEEEIDASVLAAASAQAAAESAQSTADAAKTEASDWTAGKPGIERRLAALEAMIVRSAQAPEDTGKLWLNTANDTLNYHNGTAWKTLVGRYADA